MIKIDGRFWLTKEDQNFLGSGRVELLERIDQTGSIHAAAKEMKMSYKAAWERINGMNALAEHPLIERTTGGKGGGGSILTSYAKDLIATYRRLEELHRQFLERFSQSAGDPDRLAQILNRTFLTTSARNQFHAKIEAIQGEGVNSTLTLVLDGGDHLYSTITTKSVEGMALKKSDSCYAIIKSGDTKLSKVRPESEKTMNILEGKIIALESGAEHVEILFRLLGGTELVIVMEREASKDFHLDERGYALISSHNVIIGL